MKRNKKDGIQLQSPSKSTMSRKQSGTSSHTREKGTSKSTKATTSAKKVKSTSHSGHKQKQRQLSPSPPAQESESDNDSQKENTPRKKKKKLTHRHEEPTIEEIIVDEENEAQRSENGDEIIDLLSNNEVSIRDQTFHN